MPDNSPGTPSLISDPGVKRRLDGSLPSPIFLFLVIGVRIQPYQGPYDGRENHDPVDPYIGFSPGLKPMGSKPFLETKTHHRSGPDRRKGRIQPVPYDSFSCHCQLTSFTAKKPDSDISPGIAKKIPLPKHSAIPTRQQFSTGPDATIHGGFVTQEKQGIVTGAGDLSGGARN
jgi:hypothetical protein